jgi:hypothetical protein
LSSVICHLLSAFCFLLSTHQLQGPSGLDNNGSLWADLLTAETSNALSIIENQSFFLLLQYFGRTDFHALIAKKALPFINNWL